MFRWFLSTSISTPFQDREESLQQPHLPRASENCVEPLARNEEEEPIEDDGYVREKVSIKTVISDKWLKEVFAKLLGSA